MIEQQLAEAARLSRQGQDAEARRLLVQILEIEPNNEQAWLWLGRILPDLAQRRYCLERVLKLSPENAQAHEALEVLSVLEALSTDENPERQPVRPADTPTGALSAETLSRTASVRRIGDYLVELGYVRREVVERIATRQQALRQQGKEFSLGNLLLDASLISHEQLYAAVREQEMAYQACFT
jgi:hypothetical protein